MTSRTHVVLAVCMAVAGCRERASPKGSPDPVSILHQTQQPDTTSSLPPERARVNGVGVGEASSEVRAALGRPDSVSAPQKFEGLRDSITTWFYPGLTVYFARDRVRNADCHGPRCATPDAVNVGDSLSHVERVYGPAFHLSMPGRSYPRLMYSIRGSDCNIAFDFDLALISSISLECD